MNHILKENNTVKRKKITLEEKNPRPGSTRLVKTNYLRKKFNYSNLDCQECLLRVLILHTSEWTTFTMPRIHESFFLNHWLILPNYTASWYYSEKKKKISTEMRKTSLFINQSSLSPYFVTVILLGAWDTSIHKIDPPNALVKFKF